MTEHIINVQEIVRKIFDHCWSLYIANVVVLTPSKDYAKVFVYTYFPFTPEHCESVEPILLDHFENGSFASGRSKSLFPDKFRNLHQCPLIMSSYNFTPLVFLIPQPNGSYYIGKYYSRKTYVANNNHFFVLKYYEIIISPRRH